MGKPAEEKIPFTGFTKAIPVFGVSRDVNCRSFSDTTARHCRYVLPNTSEMNRGGRGSIVQRLALADANGCELIEVPADFIKNPTEVRLTGLPFGSMLDARSISILYQAEQVPTTCAAVLHTEPELTLPSQLCWHDRAWIDAFVAMQVTLVEHIGGIPIAIEIHPGIAPNTVEDIIAGARALIDGFGGRFGKAPLILLENRTGQVVSDGPGLHRVYGQPVPPRKANSMALGYEVSPLCSSSSRQPAGSTAALTESPNRRRPRHSEFILNSVVTCTHASAGSTAMPRASAAARRP